MDILFSFSGRIGRAKWWLSQFAILMVWVVVIGAFAIFVEAVGPPPNTPRVNFQWRLERGIAIPCAVVLSV